MLAGGRPTIFTRTPTFIGCSLEQQIEQLEHALQRSLAIRALPKEIAAEAQVVAHG